MFANIISTLRAKASESGQSMAELALILAPLSVALALAVWAVFLTGSR